MAKMAVIGCCYDAYTSSNKTLELMRNAFLVCLVLEPTYPPLQWLGRGRWCPEGLMLLFIDVCDSVSTNTLCRNFMDLGLHAFTQTDRWVPA